MKLISHRGHINGKINKKLENTPIYILKAINSGFDVEIDVRKEYNEWFLGHDESETKVSKDFLVQYHKKLWIHAKNLEALYDLLNDKLFNNIFWHQDDDFTITKNKYIWTYPNKDITDKSIIVCQTPKEYDKYKKTNCFGICSDFVTYE